MYARLAERMTVYVCRAVGAKRGEWAAVCSGFLLFFCLFAAYFMLRPVRETMGITAGVEHLQWLFSATFVVMLAAVPVFGALSARVQRARLLPWVYGFFIVNLLAFSGSFAQDATNVWLARLFYVWISVFNLFAVSLAWSLLADMLRADQAKRVFAPIAAGASVGGLVGPLVGAALVAHIGLAGLMLLAAALLGASLGAVQRLLVWRARQGDGHALTHDSPRRAMGGAVFAGLLLLVRSPFLLGISLFVVLLSTTATFLYFEQARVVAASFPDPVRQTQVFGLLDAVVQALTLVTQVFVTGRIAARFGVGALLTAVPLVVALGLLALACAPGFAVLATVMVLRRVGEYALVRPGREMLFTHLSTETKYKAKTVIDTAVYRGADAMGAWLKTGIDALGAGAWLVALTGAVVASLWAALGWRLGRVHEAVQTPPRA